MTAEETGPHELRIKTSIPPDTLIETVRKRVRELAVSELPAELQRDGWTRLSVAANKRALVVKLRNIEERPEAPTLRGQVATTPDGGSQLILTSLTYPRFPWAAAIVGTIGLLVVGEMRIGGGILIAVAILLGLWELQRSRHSRSSDLATRYLRAAVIEVLHRAESENGGGATVEC